MDSLCMKSVSIERSEWPRFAATFSREHDEWVASLQVRDQTTLEERPFHGLAFEARPGRETAILIFGNAAEEHMAHIIEHPRALTLARSDDGSTASLTIVDQDGEPCVLSLLNPMCEEIEVWT